MSLKDNFYQAMKELLNNGGLVGSDMEEKAKGQSELDAYLETPAAPDADAPAYQQRAAQSGSGYAPKAPQMPQSPYAPQNREPEPEPPRREPDRSYASYSTAYNEEPASEGSGRVPSYYSQETSYGGVNYEPPQELTIISKNTIVDGNIRSFANINIQGNIRGDVSITKDAVLSGKIIGAVKCSNLEMQGSSVQGDIITKGRAMLDNDSLLLGDLSAQYVDVNGKVKGNLAITGKAEFRSNAVILGDINTSAITVMDGANIQGYINTAFLRDNADKVFPGKVSIGEEDFTAQEAAQ